MSVLTDSHFLVHSQFTPAGFLKIAMCLHHPPPLPNETGTVLNPRIYHFLFGKLVGFICTYNGRLPALRDCVGNMFVYSIGKGNCPLWVANTDSQNFTLFFLVSIPNKMCGNVKEMEAVPACRFAKLHGVAGGDTKIFWPVISQHA